MATNTAASYKPSLGAAVIGAVAFVLVALAATWLCIRHRTWVLAPFLLGVYIEAVSLVSRAYWADNLDSIHGFLYAYAGAIIAPSFLAAGCYMLISRIIWFTVPADRCSARHLWVPPRWVTLLFVGVDLLSFVIQFLGICALGSAYTSKASGNKGDATSGAQALRLGLVLQLAGFVLFAVIAVRLTFVAHFESSSSDRPSSQTQQLPVRRLHQAVTGAAAVLSLRAVYRVLEFSGVTARNSPAAFIRTHEWPYWVFDALPSLAVCILLTVFHAGHSLPPELRRLRCRPSTIAEVQLKTELSNKYEIESCASTPHLIYEKHQDTSLTQQTGFITSRLSTRSVVAAANGGSDAVQSHHTGQSFVIERGFLLPGPDYTQKPLPPLPCLRR